MDPSVGRFGSLDAFQGLLADPASLHKYNYVHGDPANRLDPTGHFASIGEISIVNSLISTIAGGQAHLGLDTIAEIAFRDNAAVQVGRAALNVIGVVGVAVGVSALAVRLMHSGLFKRFLSRIGLGSRRGVPVYRVQGGTPPYNLSKVRFSIDDTGKLSIQGNDMLWVNVNQPQRALEFQSRRGGSAHVVRFEADASFIERLRQLAVPQADAKNFPGRPQIGDPAYPDQFGIPPSMFDELLGAVLPDSVAIGVVE